MSRFNSGGGYGHSVAESLWPDSGEWTISWMYDHYDHYSRYPRTIERETDEAGAVRFALKWELPLWQIPQELKLLVETARQQ